MEKENQELKGALPERVDPQLNKEQSGGHPPEGNPPDHSKKVKPQFVTRVKLKNNGRCYDFNSNNLDIRVGENCIVDGEKGLEYGVVALAKRKIISRKRKKPLRKIIRKATEEDLERLENNRELEKKAVVFCQTRIREREIPMKLTRADFDFNGEKAKFYFSAEGRVDFRELVKDLAQEFKIKIEMWQVGARDEARLTGGCGICGNPLCCTTFLREFEPVSIRMAKDQNLSLNPMKISGVCGRLMCCLIYEHAMYAEFKKRSPRLGRTITIPDGRGRVVQSNMLREEIVVELEDGKRVTLKAEDIPPQPQRQQPPQKKKGPLPPSAKGGGEQKKGSQGKGRGAMGKKGDQKREGGRDKRDNRQKSRQRFEGEKKKSEQKEPQSTPDSDPNPDL